MIPTVAFDLDNVVVDILHSARIAAAALAEVDPGEVVDTGIYYAPFAHADPARAALMVTDHDFWQLRDILENARPMDGAVDALWRLSHSGRLRGYVTRRAPDVEDVTRSWIERHGLPPATLRHVGHLEALRNRDACKAEICHAIGATHLVDDSQDEADSALGRGIVPILVDHPLGREAREAWRSRNPQVALVPDAASAVELLLRNI